MHEFSWVFFYLFIYFFIRNVNNANEPNTHNFMV